MQDKQSQSRRVGWAFCLDPAAGTIFTVLMHLADAQQELMYKAMRFSGKDTNRREWLKAMVAAKHGIFYRPKSPVELVIEGADILQYTIAIETLMDDARKWKCVPLDRRNVELNCTAFRIASSGLGRPCCAAIKGPPAEDVC